MSSDQNRASLTNEENNSSSGEESPAARDPTKYTIPQLKSILTENNVELPAEEKRKAFYVDLYKKHIVKSSKKRKSDEVEAELSDDETEPEQKKVKPTEEQDSTTTTSSQQPSAVEEEAKVETPISEVKSKVQRKAKSFAPSALEEETPQVKVNEFRRRTIGNKEIQYRQRPVRNEINQGLLQTPVNNNSKSLPPPTPFSPTGSVQTPLGTDLRPTEIDQEQTSVGKVFSSILMASIWALFFFCVYLFLFGQRDPHLPYGGRYCPSEDGLLQLKPGENCLPCPENGYCSDGRLVLCRKPYIIKNAVCVEDSRITLNSLEFISELQNELSSKSGKFICGRADTNSSSMEDVKAQLTTRLAGTEVSVGDVLDQVTNLVKSSPQNFQMNIVKAEGSDKEIIFSTNPTLPFDCRIKKATQENKGVVITILTLAVAILIANFYKNKVEREQNDIEDLFRIAITRIREEEEPIIVEQLRDELKEKYSYEIDVDKYWSRVEDLLASDTRLSELPSTNGRAYQWISSTDKQE